MVSKASELKQDLSDGREATDEQIALIKTYMRFGDDRLIIGKSGSPITFRAVNDRVAFCMNNSQIASLLDNRLYVTQAEICP